MAHAARLPRVSILMSDAGGGHRASAMSLAEAMDGRAEVEILNLLDEFTPFPFNRFSESYGPLVNRAPWLYSFVYHSTSKRPRIVRVQRAAYALVRRRMEEALAEAAPDLVISVHPLLTSVPLRVLRAFGNDAPFVTVVTDPVTVHTSWFSPDVDLCVVATEDARQLALKAGVPAWRVEVVGLPVRKAFTDRRSTPRPRARLELGLDPDVPLVLVTGGGAGIGRLDTLTKALASRLWREDVTAQMAVITGHNKALRREMQTVDWSVPVTVLGYTDRMADWMAASDLLISKAGPGTIAEAAVMGLPVIITGFIPGQEEGNVTWVERNRVGAYCEDPDEIAELVAHWMRRSDHTLEEMAERVQTIARPDAAAEIADRALALLAKNASVKG